MLLDKLCQVLDLDSCWVQLLDAESQELRLAGSRGLTPAMMRAVGLKDSEQGLSNRVVMGHRAFIPDLSRDGVYGLTSFAQAGIRSVIAVPIRTYRTHGLIGIAGRSKRQFPTEATDLLTAIAGMLGASINSAELSRLPAVAVAPPPAGAVETDPAGVVAPDARPSAWESAVTAEVFPPEDDGAADPAPDRDRSADDAEPSDEGPPMAEGATPPEASGDPGILSPEAPASVPVPVLAEGGRAAARNDFTRHGRTMEGFRRTHR